jgi:prepilin-type processing-associated H-X9-DG protein
VNSAVAPFAPGAPVLVQWSDGHRYPATVMLVHSGQVQVAFPDGRQVWVPQPYVTPR